MLYDKKKNLTLKQEYNCSKLSSKLPQLQNMHLNLLTVTFFVIYWLSRGILRTLIIDESELFLL